MCGIAGFWSNKKVEDGTVLLERMTSIISHRGPDSAGHWSKDDRLFLGHRRLSILDLDSRSNQPFEWLGRFVLTFNGEIYNFIEIREELVKKGYVFSTYSDTEVLCAAYNEWGTACVNRFDGMFAFALFDKRNETLFCARDRFGEKPFYYAIEDGKFSFASEMKALWSIGVSKELRSEMVAQFLKDSVIEDSNNLSLTFYKHIKQIKPGHYFYIDKDFNISQTRYYYPSIDTTFKGSFEEACIRFKLLFEQSVERRMRTDVQLGGSLSGGLDSSSIIATMTGQKGVVNTFSARFKGFKRDEGTFINQVVDSFNTCHHNIYIDGTDLVAQVDKLLFHHEEPFQSASINAQFAVYKAAREANTTVLLDGQGADEYLAGYFKFLKPYYYSLPISRRKSFREEIQNIQDVEINLTFRDYLQFKWPSVFQVLSWLKQRVKGDEDFGVSVVSKEKGILPSPFIVHPNLKETLRYNLTIQGLPKLLKFADRNSMANSVEVRLPFLSHELVDFILSLPEHFFFKGAWTKSIVRHAMESSLPPDIVWRKDKIGFEAPHDLWLTSEDNSNVLNQAKEYLIEKNIITTSYNNLWNILILYRLLIIHEKEGFNHSL